jgi:hypothetical protein
MVDIQTMVIAALWGSGGRKALTPFEITSMPVTVEQPTAKARRTKNRVSVSVSPELVRRGGVPEPDNDRTVPTITRRPSAPMAK